MGRSIVENLVRQGVNVSYCARNVSEEDFAEFQTTLGPSNKARAFGSSVDISSRENIAKWVDQAGASLGRIDILIANGSWAPFNRMSWLHRLYCPLVFSLPDGLGE